MTKWERIQRQMVLWGSWIILVTTAIRVTVHHGRLTIFDVVVATGAVCALLLQRRWTKQARAKMVARTDDQR